MKKNLIPKLLFLLLLLSMINVPRANSYQVNSTEILMCEAIASVEVNTIPVGSPTTSPTPTAQAKPKATTIVTVRPTSQPTIEPSTIVTPPIAPENLAVLFETYAGQYGVSSTTLKIIANCESRFNPAALSKNGLYGGLFQYSASTWTSTRRAMGLDENPELRFNAEEAIKTTAFKIANGGIGAWPHCSKKVSL